MVTKIKKWGNSQGLRFPKDLLAQANIAVGDEVEVSVGNGRIVVKPAARKVRGRYKLKDLVANLPRNFRLKEERSGPPVGKEVW